MKLCALKDFEEVYGIFTNSIGTMADDNSGDLFDTVKHLLSSQSGMVLKPSGGTLFSLSSINSILYEAHLITTKGDKKNVYANTLKSAEWVKENTCIEVFVSNIPVIYESTLYYSEKIGMNKSGTIANGFLKNGERIDIITMSCSVNKIIRSLSCQEQQ